MEKLYSKAKRVMLLFLWLAGSYTALAQDRVVSGTVRDESGSPMPGVNVIVSGTSTGTVTDTAGKFSISVGSGARLLFSFIGYTSQEVEVGSNTVIDVSMKVDVTELSEIVVTGYASQEKKDLTGSVGTVKVKDLVQIPSSNVTNQLQGRVSGVTVNGDGRPGEPARVRIRGFGSFTNNNPLYIVDGVPTGDISNLNPNDVQSISVLKDAASSSIYGSRGSNGVIVVTTKQGSSSGVKINYDMYIGNQYPGEKPDFLLNAQEYADLQWLVYDNDGTSETHPIYGASSNAAPTLPSWAADTDWYKTITQNALIMNHDLSLSGGNQNSKFYVGLNYFNQQGIVINNFSKRFSTRINSEFKIKERVTIGENLTITGRNGFQVAGITAEGSPVARAYGAQAIIPAIVDQTIAGTSRTFVPGDYGGTGIAPRLGNLPNPLADLTRDQDDRSQDVRLLGNVFVDVKILEGLNFRSLFGGSFQNGYSTNWTGSTYERAENQATASYSESAFYNSDWLWTNTLTLNKTFGDSKLLAVGGYEAVKTGIGRGLFASRAGYFSEAYAFRTVNNGASITGASSGFNTPRQLVSLFLRADYGFKDKYLIGATIRRDGSSVFGQDNKYGVFPAFSAGWRISEESFLAGVDVISDLKLRAGWGQLGNQNPVTPQNQYFLFGGGVGETNYDLNGSGSSSLQGFRPNQIGNVDAKWEATTTTNIGFDAGLLDNKLQINFDWYRKFASDVLYNPQLPGIYGAASQPFVNIAEIENKGIDLQIDYKQVINSDFSFDASLTFTTYKNEILKVTNDVSFFDPGSVSRIGTFVRNQVGQSISSFYGYRVIGLFQTSTEVTGAPAQSGAEPGFFRYENVDASNNVIDDKDRTFIGDPNPDFTYGLNLGATYKNFDLSMFFYGSVGNDIFNYNRWWLDFWPSFQNQKSTDLLYKSWTPTRTNTNVPKASNKSNFSTNTQSVSYYVEDGSFLRMRNLQIGYTFPKSIISKAGINNLRVYMQGINLFTVSGYSGVDPDINNGGDLQFGVDYGAYPVVRQFIFGLNVGF